MDPPVPLSESPSGVSLGAYSLVIDLTEVEEGHVHLRAPTAGGPRAAEGRPTAEGLPTADGPSTAGGLPRTKGTSRGKPEPQTLQIRTRVLPWERPPAAARAAAAPAVSNGQQTSAAAAADPVALACAAAGLPVAAVRSRPLPTLRLLLPLRICLAAAGEYLQHLLLPQELKCINTLAKLLGLPSAAAALNDAARGTAASAAHPAAAETAAAPVAAAEMLEAAAAEVNRSAAATTTTAAATKQEGPLNEGAQLLLSRLLLHLLRLSITPDLPPAARRRVVSNSKSSSSSSSSSWIRLPPLLRVSREVPHAAAALRELLKRGLLILWTRETQPPAAAAAVTAAAECGHCVVAVDGICACSWSTSLLCLSAAELRVLATEALGALGALRETWGPRNKLKTRKETVSFLQQLAAGHKPHSSSSSNRRLDEFFGGPSPGTRAPLGGPQAGAPVPAAVVRAIRALRAGVVGACCCLAQLQQQQLLLQSLRVVFLATHAAHAAALGPTAATVPGYVVASAGQLLQQMQQQQLTHQQQPLQQQQHEEELFALACAAILPGVQRVAHLVDLQLRQLPRLLLQEQPQREMQSLLQEEQQQQLEQQSKKEVQQQLQEEQQQQPEQQQQEEHQHQQEEQQQQQKQEQQEKQQHQSEQHQQQQEEQQKQQQAASVEQQEPPAAAAASQQQLQHQQQGGSNSSSTSSSTPASQPVLMGKTAAIRAAGDIAAAATTAAGTTAVTADTEISHLLPVWRCSCCSCMHQRACGPAGAAASRQQLAAFAAALLAELRMAFVAPEAAKPAAAATAPAAAAETEALQLATAAEQHIRIHIKQREETLRQQQAAAAAAGRGGDRTGVKAEEAVACSSFGNTAASSNSPVEARAATSAAIEVYLLRFSAPYVWASVLWQSVQLLEQRKQHAAAAERLLLLLQLHDLYSFPSPAVAPSNDEQSSDKGGPRLQQQQQRVGVYRHRIGKWFGRLTVLLQQHLQQQQRALLEGVRCLREGAALRKAERHEIARRIIKAAISIHRKGIATNWEQLHQQALEQQQQQVSISADSSDSDVTFPKTTQKTRGISSSSGSDSSSSSSESESSSSSSSDKNGQTKQALQTRERKRPPRRRPAPRKRRRGADTPARSSGSSPFAQQQQQQEQHAFLQLLPPDVHDVLLQEYEEHQQLQEQLPLCVVSARPLAAAAAAGRSSLFVGWDGLMLRVEQLALQHYCMQGGWRGAHDEGTCLRSIFLILTAAQQQQQSKVGLLQQLKGEQRLADAAAAKEDGGLSIAFLPSVRPTGQPLLLPEQQQEQQLMLQQLQRSNRREVHALVNHAVAAVYGQPIRGVCWVWRTLTDGGYVMADEQQQQQQQQQRGRMRDRKVEMEEDELERDTEEEIEGLSAAAPLLQQQQLQQQHEVAAACGDFYGRIAAAIGGPPLAAIFSLLFEDFKSWAPGLPDLILWRPKPQVQQQQKREQEQQQQQKQEQEYQQQRQQEQQQQQKHEQQQEREQEQQRQQDAGDVAEWEVMFAEVKGPRDALSDKQKCWLIRLLAAGISCQVCRVAEPEVAERMEQQQQQQQREKQRPTKITKRGSALRGMRRAGGAAATHHKDRTSDAKQGARTFQRNDICDEPDAAAISRIERGP